MSVADIRRLAAAALVAQGASEAQAGPLADAVAAAERDGISSHGLFYVPIYCEHLTCGKVIGTATPAVTFPAPGAVRVDAGSGFAHPAIEAGMRHLIERARTQGIAVLTVFNSYNCGVLGYHTERIAAQGLVALGFTNAPASIAPWGARKPVLGTNPWSLATPDGKGGATFVIDQSASVIAKSEVMKAARAGKRIPPTWALDAEGNPTEDPNEGLKGTMAPAGGYKGVGSSLLVEVMAACLSGATPGHAASPFSGTAGGPPRTGQCFIVIDPAPSSGGDFAARLTAVAAAFTAEEGTHLPGHRKVAARARHDRDGVAVDPTLIARIRALAGLSS
jgi:(2R)-3-sulfolactate dehydrogenase (NADP+)